MKENEKSILFINISVIFITTNSLQFYYEVQKNLRDKKYPYFILAKVRKRWEIFPILLRR